MPSSRRTVWWPGVSSGRGKRPCRPKRLQEEHDRFVRTGPQPLTAADKARVEALAEDIPALWQAPTTSAADRKEVVRCLIERVVVGVRQDSEQVAVTIHWQGGFTTEHIVQRAVGRYEQLENFAQLLERILELRRQGQPVAVIAETLNREGYRTPKSRREFTRDVVGKLLSRQGLADGQGGVEQLGRQEWRLGDLAREVGLSSWKLREWVRQGWLHGRQPLAEGPWIVWADRAEIKRLKKLQARSKRGVRSHPKELTTPKNRKES